MVDRQKEVVNGKRHIGAILIVVMLLVGVGFSLYLFNSNDSGSSFSRNSLNDKIKVFSSEGFVKGI